MVNKAIWATDRSAGCRSETNAARAQLSTTTAAWDNARPLNETRFDGVLVDAPCSGVGTWQRNPHARWNTTPVDARTGCHATRAVRARGGPLKHTAG
jgi:16S rRNA (cytosine967-C5)-methyltransferase